MPSYFFIYIFYLLFIFIKITTVSLWFVYGEGAGPGPVFAREGGGGGHVRSPVKRQVSDLEDACRLWGHLMTLHSSSRCSTSSPVHCLRQSWGAAANATQQDTGIVHNNADLS